MAPAHITSEHSFIEDGISILFNDITKVGTQKGGINIHQYHPVVWIENKVETKVDGIEQFFIVGV